MENELKSLKADNFSLIKTVNEYVNKENKNGASEKEIPGTVLKGNPMSDDIRSKERELVKKDLDNSKSQEKDQGCLVCSDCGFVSQSLRGMKIHKKAKHMKDGSEDKIKCDQCDGSYSAKEHLMIHNNVYHETK